MTKPYRLCLHIILLCSWIPLFPATYYISNSGNDASNGLSETSSWQSIAQVNSRSYVAGDSILFAAGETFKGNIYLDNGSAGTVKQPIYISSFGTGRATIHAGNRHGFFAYNTSGFTIKDLIFTGSGYTINSGIGVYFYMDIPGNVSLPHIHLQNLDISGFKTSGIQIMSWPADQSKSGYRDILVEGCIAHDNGLSGISLGGYYNTSDTLYSHRNIHISRSIAHHNHGMLNMNSHSGNGIIVGQVDSCVISYCEAYENGKNNNYPGGGPAGIWAWDSRHVTIQYSYAHHNRSQTGDGDGFDLDGGVQNSVMQYNYAHDNDGPGFLIAQYTGARHMKNNIVRYNISERDGKGLGALIWSGDPAGIVTAEKIDFYQNTIYIDTAGNSFANAALAVYNNYGAMKDIRICNNILVARNNVNMLDVNRTMNLKFYNNVYYDHGNGYHFRDNGTDYTSLNNWRNATGQEIYNGKFTGYRSNPALIGPGNGGAIEGVDSLQTLHAYRLHQQSPIIGAGLVIDTLLGFNSVTRDFYGDTVIPRSKLTPGAHEIQLPKAQFSFSNHCLGPLSVFKNSSSHASSYQWRFGDGTTSQDASPTHQYANAGIYTVTLLVHGQFGYVDSIRKTLEIYAPPIADFMVMDVCLGDSSKISNQSVQAISYQWQFGDSTRLTGFQPVHTHARPGKYEIQLLAFSGNGCRDSIKKSIEVFALPWASFTTENNCLGDSSRFINNSRYGDSFIWDFGDGTKSDETQPTRLYPFAGTYKVTLIAIDSNHCSARDTCVMDIYEKPEVGFKVLDHCLGTPLQIPGLQVRDSSCHWDFGDGSSSTATYPIHHYKEPGFYRISLSVTNTHGCSDSAMEGVLIYPLPSAAFTYKNNGDTYLFMAQDSMLPVYQWRINDSAISNAKEFSYTLIPGKSYQVSLTCINVYGCMDTNAVWLNDSLTSLHGAVTFDNLNMYPNPFTLCFSIDLPLSDDAPLIRIKDVLGRCVYTLNIRAGDQHPRISMTDFPLEKGIYILTVHINGHWLERKFIKE